MITGPEKLDVQFAGRWSAAAATARSATVHRSAALRDRSFELVAGALDIDPDRGRAFGIELGIAAERCYPNDRAMFEAEAQRPDGIEAVSVATPNNTHFDIAKCALERGLHVVCEKPLCFTIAEADELRRLAATRKKIVGVTYGYAGHQMIEQGRAMVARGDLGDIRLVNLQFAHGFHSEAVEGQVSRLVGASTRAPRVQAMCSATSARIRFTSPRRSRRI